ELVAELRKLGRVPVDDGAVLLLRFEAGGGATPKHERILRFTLLLDDPELLVHERRYFDGAVTMLAEGTLRLLQARFFSKHLGNRAERRGFGGRGDKGLRIDGGCPRQVDAPIRTKWRGNAHGLVHGETELRIPHVSDYRRRSPRNVRGSSRSASV